MAKKLKELIRKLDTKIVFGKGKNKVEVKNIRKVRYAGLDNYYKVDIYVKGDKFYTDHSIMTKNLGTLEKYVKKAFPKKLIPQL